MTAGREFVEANPGLASLGFVEGILNRRSDDLDRQYHVVKPIDECIVAGSWPKGIVDSYLNREIRICLHFHSGPISTESEFHDSVISFEKAIASDLPLDHIALLGQSQHGVNVAYKRRHNVKPVVPVLDRPIIQNVEEIIGVSDPVFGFEFNSLVRLHTFDENPDSPWEHPIAFSALLVAATTVANLESKVSVIGGRVLSRGLNARCVNTRVKCGAELIKYLAKQEREFYRERVISTLNDDLSFPITIYMNENLIWIVFNEVFPELGKFSCVRFCPIDSAPARIKSLEWTHEGVTDYGVTKLKRKGL